MRRTATEKRVLAAIRYARMMVPHYGAGTFVTGLDRDRLLEFGRIKIRRVNISIPAVLTDPEEDEYRRLYLAAWLPAGVQRYIELHECGHSLAGDADEPTILHFQGPMPEAEEVADLFALAGVLNDDDCAHGAEWVESRMRALVPLDDRGWQMYRVPQLAPKVIRMRQLIKEWL